jgi:hypothetical protein
VAIGAKEIAARYDPIQKFYRKNTNNKYFELEKNKPIPPTRY